MDTKDEGGIFFRAYYYFFEISLSQEGIRIVADTGTDSNFK